MGARVYKSTNKGTYNMLNDNDRETLARITAEMAECQPPELIPLSNFYASPDQARRYAAEDDAEESVEQRLHRHRQEIALAVC